MTGRRRIWSDASIQKLTGKFVCAADESWALDPPSWATPPNPVSTKLFRNYRSQASHIIPKNGSTVQGVYCMTPDGDFLSGEFACSKNDSARRVIEEGWRKFQALAERRGYAQKPVPTNRLGHQQGEPAPPGGLKLEVAVRDLPGKDGRTPGNSEWQKKAFNLNWLDLSADEAAQFVTTKREKVPLPDALVQKLALKALKDTARGQSDWPRNGFRGGAMFTECVASRGGKLALRITGNVRLEGKSNHYAPAILGQAIYDSKTKAFDRFELVAAGERQGGTSANFRHDDATAGLLGVAIVMAN